MRRKKGFSRVDRIAWRCGVRRTSPLLKAPLPGNPSTPSIDCIPAPSQMQSLPALDQAQLCLSRFGRER
ncbi:uncharacterized protein STEHIDRAFT_135711 [Stereum hirsutum FP-91666 SS1]|uniref:Uncharacterized protein n=1 Tax=Stereum hirsutum (strain FP-91666) TaxID=721885 RepID=R7RW81_STEHR|nr:uncharacterized protein STEHIDRAFT_135711 [Stereum hirsutum FP-91666 SS1]EIM79581.1 hypothetical protein STEHIDRAFT_135711 [Stereum hirsutum FP-91666 SS1]